MFAAAELHSFGLFVDAGPLSHSPVGGRGETRRFNPPLPLPISLSHFELDVTWITEAVAACWYESLNRSHLPL